MGLLSFTDDFNQVLDEWDGTVGAPSRKNRKRTAVRVYKNGFMEHVIATSHPAMPGLWFGPFIAYGLYVAITGAQGLGLGLATFAAGIVAFSLLEYCLHRFPFHWPPGPTRTGRLRLFIMHGYHHQFPNDPRRLVAPPALSWPIAAVVLLAYWLLLGSPHMWTLFGGTAVGYLGYDWIHYYTHHARSPSTFIGKRLRRAHAVHHYQIFHLNMGISSPLWDYVFGTFAWSDDTVKKAIAETRSVERMQTDG